MIKKTNSFREFILAFGSHWSEYMSGGPSIPLMLAALFIPTHWVAVGTGLTGIFCAVVASYLVWSQERRLVVALAGEIDAKPLEIVLRHGPTFQRGYLDLNTNRRDAIAGNYWRIALFNSLKIEPFAMFLFA